MGSLIEVPFTFHFNIIYDLSLIANDYILSVLHIVNNHLFIFTTILNVEKSRIQGLAKFIFYFLTNGKHVLENDIPLVFILNKFFCFLDESIKIRTVYQLQQLCLSVGICLHELICAGSFRTFKT